MRHSRACNIPDGFTLVELLVVIAVVAVLVAIALPALRGARIRSYEMVALSNIRGIGATIEAYANTQRNAYPLHDPGKFWYPKNPITTVGIGTDDPWAMSYLWHYILQSVAPLSENHASWINVGVQKDPDTVPVSYRYSNSFIARPEMWSDQPASAESREALFAPTFTHEVSSPSLKALMYDGDRAYLFRDPTPKDRRAILTADGAAALRLDSESLRPVQNRYDNTAPRLYHDTANGVRGRDY